MCSPSLGTPGLRTRPSLLRQEALGSYYPPHLITEGTCGASWQENGAAPKPSGQHATNGEPKSDAKSASESSPIW